MPQTPNSMASEAHLERRPSYHVPTLLVEGPTMSTYSLSTQSFNPSTLSIASSFTGGGSEDGAQRLGTASKRKHKRRTIRTSKSRSRNGLSSPLPDMKSLKEKAMYRADNELTLQHLNELMNQFMSASNGGRGKMTLEQFKQAFRSILGRSMSEEQMSILFMQIDHNTDNVIDWDEFSTYILLRAQGQTQMQEEAESHLFNLESPVYPTPTPHREGIHRIQYLSGVNRYLTSSRDGTVCVWTERLRLQRSFKNQGLEHAVVRNKKQQSVTGSETTPKLGFFRWTHDCVYMPDVSKIACASDDHEITIYDFQTFEPLVRINLKGMVAMCLDYHSGGDDNDSFLIWGTDTGHVCILAFQAAIVFGPTGIYKKRDVEVVNIDSFLQGGKGTSLFRGTLTKRHVHPSWCTKVRYVKELDGVVSCSSDETKSLGISTQDVTKWVVQTVGVKKGVSVFAYSRFPLAIVTGGTDHRLRIYNPRRLHSPSSILRGHSAPIVDITISEEHGHIISLSTDKMIKVWDLRNNQCLQNIIDTFVHHPEDKLSSLFFGSGRLIAASSSMLIYPLKDDSDSPNSHNAPICSALYNSAFKQVVSGCDNGVVNVWDLGSGQKMFKFSGVHDAEITAMAFDSNLRKLVTGSRDGSIRVWNFNNGQLRHELKKSDTSEVTSIQYVTLNGINMICVTGWNRRVTLFRDDSETFTVFPSQHLPIDSSEPWHQDDILSMSFAPPNWLATSSSDGEIFVTNTVSGRVVHQFCPFSMQEFDERSIDVVLFLRERLAKSRKAAHLLSIGADGVLRFWNIWEGFLMWEYDVGCGAYAMCVDEHDSFVFIGDSSGRVKMLDISNAGQSRNTQKQQIQVLANFSAHSSSITSIQFIEEENLDLVVTASTDCTIRCFTTKGQFVGVFGQSESWNFDNPRSWGLHPPVEAIRADTDGLTPTLQQRYTPGRARRGKSRTNSATRLGPSKSVVSVSKKRGAGPQHGSVGMVVSSRTLHFGDRQQTPESGSSASSSLSDLSDVSGDTSTFSSRYSSRIMLPKITTTTSSSNVSNDSYSHTSSFTDLGRQLRQPTPSSLFNRRSSENMTFKQEEARLKTADYLRPDYYTSKFTKSLFAQNKLIRKPSRDSARRVKMDLSIDNIFRNLAPRELNDAALTQALAAIGKPPRMLAPILPRLENGGRPSSRPNRLKASSKQELSRNTLHSRLSNMKGSNGRKERIGASKTKSVSKSTDIIRVGSAKKHGSSLSLSRIGSSGKNHGMSRRSTRASRVGSAKLRSSHTRLRSAKRPKQA